MNVNILEALFLTELKDCVKMCIMAVNTTIWEKSPKMKITTILLTIVDCTKKLFVLEEISVLYILCNKSKILINDSSRTYVHMANLRVTHLSVRKTYCKTWCITLLERAFCHQLIDIRGLTHVNRICFMIIWKSESIKDHQYYRFFTHSKSSLYLA